MFAPGNKACGGPTYKGNVLDILKIHELRKPREYFLAVPGITVGRDHVWEYIQLIKRYYTDQHPSLSASLIANDLADLVADTYPKLQAQTGSLDFSDLPAFAKSYLHMIRVMDMTKAER